MTPNRLSLAFLGAFIWSLISVVPSVFAASNQKPMPETYLSEHTGVPRWVSASYLKADTRRMGDLARSDQVVLSAELSATHEDDCPRASSLGPHSELQGATLPETFELARYAFVGRLTGSEAGFYQGFPATLFRIETEEVLKGAPSVGREHFFVSSAADFEFRGTRICRRSDSLPGPVAIGDQMLILHSLSMDQGKAHPPQEFLGLLSAGKSVVLGSTGKLHLARRYRMADPTLEGMAPDALLEMLAQGTREAR